MMLVVLMMIQAQEQELEQAQELELEQAQELAQELELLNLFDVLYKKRYY